MKSTAFIILILFVQTTYSQTRNIQVEGYQSPDSSLWYNWRMKLCDQINLDSIQKTEHKTHFRLWTNRQVIDLWENSDGKKNGRLTSWTAKYSEEYDFDNQKTHFNAFILDSLTTVSLFSLIDSSSILTIPDSDAIKNWGNGKDGITYIIENADTENYFFKSYWTPEVQDSISEAILVQNFVNQFLSITDANNVWAEFVSTIPFECYINGGPMVTCQFLTRKEKRNLRKESKRHR